MKRDDSLEAVKNELRARDFDNELLENKNWKDLIKILKDNEGDKTFFTPVTNYNNFKWSPVRKNK